MDDWGLSRVGCPMRRSDKHHCERRMKIPGDLMETPHDRAAMTTLGEVDPRVAVLQAALLNCKSCYLGGC